jgi:ABC-type nitrate/sulfonate/bicarbonate transport system permease component
MTPTIESRETMDLEPVGPTHLRFVRRVLARLRLTYFIVLAGALASWQALAASHVFPKFAVPAPLEVYHAFITLTTTGYLGSTLQQDLLVSFVRVSTAFAGGVLIGVVIGIVMSENRVIFAIVDPFLQFLRPIPPLAYVPLFVVWFGIGELPKVLLILVSVVPVLILNTANGVRNTPGYRVEVARNLGATRPQILRRVVLPSALPDIFAGMKVAIGVAWSTLVAAELIAASQGLGWLIEQAGTQLQTSYVVTGIIVIGIVGYTMDISIRLLERLIVPWRDFA